MVLDILIFPNLTFTRAASILWISSSITCVRVHIPCCQKMAATLPEPRPRLWHLAPCYYHVPVHVPTSYITLRVSSLVSNTQIFSQTWFLFPDIMLTFALTEEVDTNYTNNLVAIVWFVSILKFVLSVLDCLSSRPGFISLMMQTSILAFCPNNWGESTD